MEVPGRNRRQLLAHGVDHPTEAMGSLLPSAVITGNPGVPIQKPALSNTRSAMISSTPTVFGSGPQYRIKVHMLDFVFDERVSVHQATAQRPALAVVASSSASPSCGVRLVTQD
jgi:hypothetical protein